MERSGARFAVRSWSTCGTRGFSRFQIQNLECKYLGTSLKQTSIEKVATFEIFAMQYHIDISILNDILSLSTWRYLLSDRVRPSQGPRDVCH